MIFVNCTPPFSRAPDTHFTTATFIPEAGPSTAGCRICSLLRSTFHLSGRGAGSRGGRAGTRAARHHVSHTSRARPVLGIRPSRHRRVGARAPRAVETRFKGRSRQTRRRSGRPLTSLASRLKPGSPQGLDQRGRFRPGVGRGLDTNALFASRGFSPPPLPSHVFKESSDDKSVFSSRRGDGALWTPRKGGWSGPGAEQARQRLGARLPGTRLVQKEQVLSSLHVRVHSEMQHFKTAQARALTPELHAAPAQIVQRRKPDSSWEAKRVPDTSSQLKTVRNWRVEV